MAVRRAAARRRAAFVDKDGTLVENVPYNVDPRLVELTEGATEGLRMLAEAGYAIVIASNQSGIARGLFAREALAVVEERVRSLLAPSGVDVVAFRHCPHLPDGTVLEFAITCECRKPAPGMLLDAARELEIDLPASWMIGDILDDVEAGHRAGCRSVLVDRGNETKWELSPARTPDVVVANLADAAREILASDRAPASRALTAERT